MTKHSSGEATVMGDKKTIVCPKCGQIDRYKVLRLYQRFEIIDTAGNTDDGQKLEFLGEEAPLCPFCDSKVVLTGYANAVSISKMKLSSLGLSTRAFNGICRGVQNNYHVHLPDDPTVVEIAQYMTVHDITDGFRNIGKKTADEIIKKFEECGITLPEN